MKTPNNNQKKTLDEIAVDYSTQKGMDKFTNDKQFEIIKPHLKGNQVLELGCADGRTTFKLATVFNSVLAIDGSEKAIKRLKRKISTQKISLIVSLFEDFETPETFDCIVMAHILEHVDDPTFIIKKYSKMLNKHGKIIISVPNALSFHRLAAVKMGILKSPYELNITDLRIGHKRVFDQNKLLDITQNCNLKVDFKTAYWLKFLSNTQILENWSDQMISAFMDLGDYCPDHAAEIVFVCSLNEN